MKIFYKLLFFCLMVTVNTYTYAQIETRIVGGNDTDIDQVPWQVLLEINGNDACGGTIIAQDWILTACHCTFSGGDPINASDIEVFAGITLRTQKNNNGQSSSVAEIIRHPDFNLNDFNNDIALLRLSSDLNYNNNVQAIDFATETDANAGWIDPGVIATVSGWGRLCTSCSRPNHLQSVDIPIVANNSLDEGDYSNPITNNMLAAGDNGSGACHGDSGGPLVVTDGNNRNLVAGIVSFRSNSGCANSDDPEIFTRVSRYDTWITENIVTLAGPSEICNSTDYTPHILPTGGNVTGATASNNINIINTSNNSVTVEPESGSGGAAGENGWVDANINIEGDIANLPQRFVNQVGEPKASYISVNPSNDPLVPGAYNYFYASYSKGDINSFQWLYPYNWDCQVNVDDELQCFVPSSACGGSYRIDVAATNDCGTSNYNLNYYSVQSCYYSASISPNPADEGLKIELSNTNSKGKNTGLSSSSSSSPIEAANETSENYIKTVDYEIKLFDPQGKEVYCRQSTSLQEEIDISALTAGIYKLNIIHPDGVIQRQVIVE